MAAVEEVMTATLARAGRSRKARCVAPPRVRFHPSARGRGLSVCATCAALTCARAHRHAQRRLEGAAQAAEVTQATISARVARCSARRSGSRGRDAGAARSGAAANADDKLRSPLARAVGGGSGGEALTVRRWRVRRGSASFVRMAGVHTLARFRRRGCAFGF
jgi:hypothetical protein